MKPKPPEDVRLTFHDGSVLPVEVYYGGEDAGLHIWICTYDIPASRADHITGVRTAYMPPHTALRFDAS